jgi:hypothetical protein
MDDLGALKCFIWIFGVCFYILLVLFQLMFFTKLYGIDERPNNNDTNGPVMFFAIHIIIFVIAFNTKMVIFWNFLFLFWYPFCHLFAFFYVHKKLTSIESLGDWKEIKDILKKYFIIHIVVCGICYYFQLFHSYINIKMAWYGSYAFFTVLPLLIMAKVSWELFKIEKRVYNDFEFKV